MIDTGVILAGRNQNPKLTAINLLSGQIIQISRIEKYKEGKLRYTDRVMTKMGLDKSEMQDQKKAEKKEKKKFKKDKKAK